MRIAEKKEDRATTSQKTFGSQSSATYQAMSSTIPVSEFLAESSTVLVVNRKGLEIVEIDNIFLVQQLSSLYKEEPHHRYQTNN